MPGVRVEDPREERRAVVAGHAEPVDRAVAAYERSRVAICEQAVLGDRTKISMAIRRGVGGDRRRADLGHALFTSVTWPGMLRSGQGLAALQGRVDVTSESSHRTSYSTRCRVEPPSEPD